MQEALSREDEEFLEKMDSDIRDFVLSEKPQLELEPMNAYRRRLVHRLGGLYHITSHSMGEDEGRYVCLEKTPETEIPEEDVDFSEVVELDKKPQQPDKLRGTRNDKGGRNEKNGRNDRNDKNDRSRGRSSEGFVSANQVYRTIPGTLIILRNDGSFGILRSDDRPNDIVEKRVVDDGVFKIIRNRIICTSDKEWAKP
ncbi:R3H domain-containing nucleic acid-binding protein [Deltaproteobacteria bacterium TL4]